MPNMDVPVFATKHEACTHERLVAVSAQLEAVLEELQVQQLALANADAVVQQQQQQAKTTCPTAAAAAVASVQNSCNHGRVAHRAVEASLVCTDHALQTLLEVASDSPTLTRALRTRLAACAAAYTRARVTVPAGRACARRMAAVATRVTQAAAAGACWDPDADLTKMTAWQHIPKVALQTFLALQHHPQVHALQWDWPNTLHTMLQLCRQDCPATGARVAALLEAWPCAKGLAHHWWPQYNAARQDALGMTALMRACNDGDLASVLALLAHAPSRLGVNLCKRGGISALMLASCSGHVDVVNALLQWRRTDDSDLRSCPVRVPRRGHCRRRRGPGCGNGCGGTAVNPTLRSKQGLDALWMAMEAGHVPVMQALLAHPAVQGTLNVPRRSINGMHTALSWACRLAKEPVIDALLAFFAEHPHLLDVHLLLDVHTERAQVCSSALHVAVRWCSPRVVKALLERAPPTRAQCQGLAHALVNKCVRVVDTDMFDVICALPPDRLDTTELSTAFINALRLRTPPDGALELLRRCADRLDLRVRVDKDTALDVAVQQHSPAVLAALLALPADRFDVSTQNTVDILYNCATMWVWFKHTVISKAMDAGRIGSVATVTEDGSTIAERLVQKACDRFRPLSWFAGLVRTEHCTAASAPMLVHLMVRMRAPVDVVAACAQRCVDAGISWDLFEYKSACSWEGKMPGCTCKTPLVCLAAFDQPDVLQALLALRPQDARLHGKDGTALHYAVNGFCPASVRALRLLPADCVDMNARDCHGHTATERARWYITRGGDCARLQQTLEALEACPCPSTP